MYIDGSFKMKCTKSLDEMIDRKDKSHVIGFQTLGNGNIKNIKTCLTSQVEFVINIYQMLLQKEKVKELCRK